jgi:hypothetical protein
MCPTSGNPDTYLECYQWNVGSFATVVCRITCTADWQCPATQHCDGLTVNGGGIGQCIVKLDTPPS